MINYSNDELVKSIKRRASMPSSDSLFNPEDFLALAYEEMLDTIVPLIMSAKAEFFVSYKDFQFNSTNIYPIPHDAISMKLKDVSIVDSNGQELFLDQLSDDSSQLYYSPTGFKILSNSVKVFADSSSSRVVRLYYYKRPNKLVENKKAGQVVSINTLTNELTLSNTPSSWNTTLKVCCIKGTPGFETVFDSQSIIAVSSPVIEISDVSKVTIGDWICLEDESAVAQIPYEGHSVIIQGAVVKALESIGDPKMQVSAKRYDQILNSFINVISPRVDGAPKKIVSSKDILNTSRYRFNR